jgi:hypothetical protein
VLSRARSAVETDSICGSGFGHSDEV